MRTTGASSLEGQPVAMQSHGRQEDGPIPSTGSSPPINFDSAVHVTTKAPHPHTRLSSSLPLPFPVVEVGARSGGNPILHWNQGDSRCKGITAVLYTIELIKTNFYIEFEARENYGYYRRCGRANLPASSRKTFDVNPW